MLTSRAPEGAPVADRIEEEPHGRGGRERDVVGGLDGVKLSLVERLGDRLVQRHHVDLGAALASAAGQHVAGLRRPGDQSPPDGDSGERLDQPLGDEPLGHDVGDHALLAQRGGGSRDRSPPPVPPPTTARHGPRPPGARTAAARRWGS